ncbi:hypothetical protein R3P38DRAFT_3101338 [Favolaschia claudopus]|uniref:Uncharacterized protein n=1 Tax=Favolaschia claudopus TaxID=2862362 RepID=A0AAV9ZM16_9AGAR
MPPQNQNPPYPWIPEFGLYPPNHLDLESDADSAKNPLALAIAAGPAGSQNPSQGPRNVLYPCDYNHNSNAGHWEALNATSGFGVKELKQSCAAAGTLDANFGRAEGRGVWESKYEYRDVYTTHYAAATPLQDRIYIPTTWTHPAGGMGLLMPWAWICDDYSNYESRTGYTTSLAPISNLGLMICTRDIPSPGHGWNYTHEHRDGGRVGPNALSLDISGANGYTVEDDGSLSRSLPIPASDFEVEASHLNHAQPFFVHTTIPTHEDSQLSNASEVPSDESKIQTPTNIALAFWEIQTPTSFEEKPPSSTRARKGDSAPPYRFPHPILRLKLRT